MMDPSHCAKFLLLTVAAEGEIGGELKSTLQSAITDLERGIDQSGLEQVNILKKRNATLLHIYIEIEIFQKLIIFVF